jgi:hypothetical protein
MIVKSRDEGGLSTVHLRGRSLARVRYGGHQMFASWNQIASWLRQIDGLRRVA